MVIISQYIQISSHKTNTILYVYYTSKKNKISDAEKNEDQRKC